MGPGKQKGEREKILKVGLALRCAAVSAHVSEVLLLGFLLEDMVLLAAAGFCSLGSCI